MITIQCLGNKIYDRFKQTWLASKLFFGGNRFTHFGTKTLEGFVSECEKKAFDGDTVFDLHIPVSKACAPDGNCYMINALHCELTPCQSEALHREARALKIGDHVIVTGRFTFDPNHLGHPSHFEIHPVTDLRVL